MEPSREHGESPLGRSVRHACLSWRGMVLILKLKLTILKLCVPCHRYRAGLRCLTADCTRPKVLLYRSGSPAATTYSAPHAMKDDEHCNGKAYGCCGRQRSGKRKGRHAARKSGFARGTAGTLVCCFYSRYVVGGSWAVRPEHLLAVDALQGPHAGTHGGVYSRAYKSICKPGPLSYIFRSRRLAFRGRAVRGAVGSAGNAGLHRAVP